MLNIFLVFAFLSPLFSSIYPDNLAEQTRENPTITWLNLEEAYQLNKKEPRKIIVDVYTDWCGWCKKMDKDTFADPKVTEYVNEHYYAVKLNAEGKGSITIEGDTFTETEIARQFQVSSYPTIVFIDKDFHTFQPVPGYRDAVGFLDVLEKFNTTNMKGAASN